MSEVMRQALLLTAWGMGMTFSSIGALALGMYLLTYLTRERQPEISPAPALDEVGRVDTMSLAEASSDAAEGRRRALAAAVAVAQAVVAYEQPPLALHGEARPGGDEVWNSYARGLHLSRRAHYEARRVRG